jgi:hypothetical protein
MKNELTETEITEIVLNIEAKYSDLTNADWHRVVEMLMKRTL